MVQSECGPTGCGLTGCGLTGCGLTGCGLAGCGLLAAFLASSFLFMFQVFFVVHVEKLLLSGPTSCRQLLQPGGKLL